MTPGKLNFTCPQGSTFSRTLTYKINDNPVNLTGYSAKMQVRPFHYSDDLLIDLSSSSGITLGASAGTIAVLVSASATQEIPAGDYVYDLEITTESNVYRLVEGKFVVTPEVTR